MDARTQQQLHKKLYNLSKQNKKLIESISSKLILECVEQQSNTKRSDQDTLNLRKEYQNLLRLSNESLAQNEQMQLQLDQKDSVVDHLKEQVQQLEFRNKKLQEDLDAVQRENFLTEQIEKQIEFQAHKANSQLKKIIEQLQLKDRASETKIKLLEEKQNNLENKQILKLKQQLCEVQAREEKSALELKQKTKECKLLKAELQQNKDSVNRLKSQLEKLQNKKQKLKQLQGIQHLIKCYKDK